MAPLDGGWHDTQKQRPLPICGRLSLTRVRKRRSFAATNRCSRRSSSARQSRGEIQVVPGYGIPRAARNRGCFAFLRDPKAGGNKGGFPAFRILNSHKSRHLQQPIVALSPSLSLLSPELPQLSSPLAKRKKLPPQGA